MSTPPTITTRRVPPPCWTQEETLALVNAYAARWLSLNRGNLRTSDWDAVSSDVSSSKLGTPKSSVQCRHKIEKLRKRYRSEKQRSLAVPGRFISSWDLFPLLDSMNFGSSSTASNRDHDGYDQKTMDINGFRVKIGNDMNLVTKYGKVDDELNQDFGLNRDLKREFLRNYGKIDFDDDFGGGFGLKMINDDNLVNLESRAKDFMDIDGDTRSHIGLDRDLGVVYGVKMHGDRNSMSHRSRSSRKIDDDKSSLIIDSEYNFEGIPTKNLVDRILVPPPGFKPKNYRKIDGNLNVNTYSEHDADYGGSNGSGSDFYIKSLHDGDFVPSRSRLKNYGRIDRNFNDTVDLCVMNEYGSSSKMRFEKKKNGDGGVKRGLDPFEELVSSITLLTERFVKIEEMKMQMARETQKIRMEMEMKHNQMLLDSQQYILDAFVTGLSEKKKKKKKMVKVEVEVVSPN